MDFKDPQVQKTIIVVILIVILGYVYFFTSFMPFFHPPMRAKIGTLSSEYEKMSAELEKARRTVGNLAKLEKEYHRLHEKWVAAQGLLPQEKEVSQLLRKVTRAGSQAGVDFTLFEPKPPVRREFVTENPVRVMVRGEYHEIGVFLSKVANLDRIINVSNLRIRPLKDNEINDKYKLGRTYTVEAEMVMTAYTLQEGGEVVNENEKTNM
ncbi:MAG: type 4a pilus biogenesis protein PilO [Candidatus Krumholzibacteriota bacterium]|nr:type 4a pilus biogenesis protein PilO [Candidatus Krumholzibacteriota bacterium]